MKNIGKTGRLGELVYDVKCGISKNLTEGLINIIDGVPSFEVVGGYNKCEGEWPADSDINPPKSINAAKGPNGKFTLNFTNNTSVEIVPYKNKVVTISEVNGKKFRMWHPFKVSEVESLTREDAVRYFGEAVLLHIVESMKK